MSWRLVIIVVPSRSLRADLSDASTLTGRPLDDERIRSFYNTVSAVQLPPNYSLDMNSFPV